MVTKYAGSMAHPLLRHPAGTLQGVWWAGGGQGTDSIPHPKERLVRLGGFVQDRKGGCSISLWKQLQPGRWTPERQRSKS